MLTVLGETILYLSRAEVTRLLPSLPEQLELARQTYVAHALGHAELPPKPGVHPREGAFIHAMPVYLADRDIAAVKWIGGSRANTSRGLPYLSGLIILNDGETGCPRAVLEAAEITGARTAAASAVCIAAFAPQDWSAAAIIGCGEQARHHLRAIEALNPTAQIRAFDRNIERARALGGRSSPCVSAREAAQGADVIITAIPLSRDGSPSVGVEALDRPVLVLPVDFDASVDACVPQQADLFLVDDEEQFEYYRRTGFFGGWPKPTATVGNVLSSESRAERVVCCNLGIAALDAVFADAVHRSAIADGAGIALPV